MSPDAHARLVELDALSREGREFYQYAATVLPASALRERCQRLLRTKSELVALLAQRLHGGRDPRGALVPAPRPRERIGPAYARVRACLGAPDASQLAGELARIEAAMARACAAQASSSRDADCRQAMAWVLPVLECCLEQVRAPRHH